MRILEIMSYLFRSCRCRGECSHSTTRIAILIDHEIDIDTEEERLLQLRAIRPVQLKLDALSGILSDLLRKAADQVAGTVTSLSIVHLSTDSPLTMYDAFSPFRNNARLAHLCLEDLPQIRLRLYAVASVTSLVRLDLVTSDRAFPEWEDVSMEEAHGFGLNLAALQSLPSLRELSIRMQGLFEDVLCRDHFVTVFLLGSILCFTSDQGAFCHYTGESNAKAFALMLCHLENLEKFSKL